MDTNQNVKDGGPAFPHEVYMQSQGGIGGRYVKRVGMSLRDYFAAHAMTGLLMNIGGDLDAYASFAYKMADAMLAERAK